MEGGLPLKAGREAQSVAPAALMPRKRRRYPVVGKVPALTCSSRSRIAPQLAGGASFPSISGVPCVPGHWLRLARKVLVENLKGLNWCS